MNKTTRHRSLAICTLVLLLLTLASGCGKEPADPAQRILGRWRVIDKEGMSVPNSFFWAMMDFVEFRKEGVVWALIHWPPDGGDEIRLNATGQYALADDGRIEFVGSCRHQDPCTGTYTIAFSGKNGLQIASEDATLSLERVGPPSEAPPLEIEGPSPSPTPAATE